MKQRCTFTNCAKFARPGEDRCTAHRGAIDHPPDVGPSIAHARISAGDYRAVIGDLADDIADAAAASGVTSEIGILRLVMARVLAEESNPTKLAGNVAKLAGVIIQAQRAQRAISGESADTLTDAVATILEELQA